MKPIQARLRQHINKIGGASYANDQLRKRRENAYLEKAVDERTQEEHDRFQAIKEKREDDRYYQEIEDQQKAEMQRTEQEWLNNRSKKAKRKDLESLGNILAGGAYGEISKRKETQYQEEFIYRILKKYGEDPQIISVLDEYGWDIEDEDDDIYETTEECSVPGRKKDNFLNDDKCFAVARSILAGKKIHETIENAGFSNDSRWQEAEERIMDGENISEVLEDYGFI